MKLRALCLLTFLMFTARAQAATYYVSTSGSDANSCATATSTTQSNAKRHISSGISCLSPGDILDIRSGTYTDILDIIDTALYTVPDGTSGSRIVIRAHSGETVTIVPPGENSGISLRNTVTEYVTFQFIKINKSNGLRRERCGGNDAVYIGYGSNHIFLEDMEIYNSSANGIQMSDTNGNSPFNEVRRTSIHTNGQSTDNQDCTTGAGEHTGYGLYIGTSDNTFDHLDVYDNGGYGAHFYDNDGSIYVGRNIISNSKFHGNGTHGGTVCGLIMGAALGTLDGGSVFNDLFYGNMGVGLCLYTDLKNTLVANNTAYGNAGYGISAQYTGSGITISNNLLYGNASGGYHDYGDGTGTPTFAATNLTTDPTYTNAGAADFSISAGSAALNVGSCNVAVTVDIIGTARPNPCDAGAYEYTSGGSSPVISALVISDGQRTVGFQEYACATEGSGSYTWDVSAGSLPAGVTAFDLTSTCMSLSGTPTTATGYSFTLRVTDSLAATATRAYSITVYDTPGTCSGGTAPWTLRTNSCVGASAATATSTVTTGTFTSVAGDTTWCAVAQNKDVGRITPTDNKTNTWTLVGEDSQVYGLISLFKSVLTSAGSGHTVSANPAGTDAYPAIQCVTFAGARTSSTDQVVPTASLGVGVVSLATSLTGTQTQELVITAMNMEDTNYVAMSGYTVYQYLTSTTANGVALAWKTSATVTPLTPTWTWTNSMDASSVTATFFNQNSYVPRLHRNSLFMGILGW